MRYFYLFISLFEVSMMHCAALERGNDVASMRLLIESAKIGQKVPPVFVDRFDRSEHTFNPKTPIDTLVALCLNKTKNEWQYAKLRYVFGLMAVVQTTSTGGPARCMSDLRNLLPNQNE